MFRRIAIVAVSVLALPLAAYAQSTGGSYLSVGGGFNKMQQEDADVKLSASGADSTGEVLTDVGPAVIIAFGHKLPSGLRLEGEYSFRSNGIKGESGLSGEDFGTGTEKKTGIMGNVLYEFHGTTFTPYIGGGAGAQFVHEPDANSTSNGTTVSVTGGTQGSFAWQFIAGGAFAVHKNVAITIDYRYLSLLGTRTYTGTATVPGFGTFDLTDSSSNDRNHSIVFGVRFGFGG
jgi:opacity protein-like surface antigen